MLPIPAVWDSLYCEFSVRRETMAFDDYARTSSTLRPKAGSEVTNTILGKFRARSQFQSPAMRWRPWTRQIYQQTSGLQRRSSGDVKFIDPKYPRRSDRRSGIGFLNQQRTFLKDPKVVARKANGKPEAFAL